MDTVLQQKKHQLSPSHTNIRRRMHLKLMLFITSNLGRWHWSARIWHLTACRTDVGKLRDITLFSESPVSDQHWRTFLMFIWCQILVGNLSYIGQVGSLTSPARIWRVHVKHASSCYVWFCSGLGYWCHQTVFDIYWMSYQNWLAMSRPKYDVESTARWLLGLVYENWLSCASTSFRRIPKSFAPVAVRLRRGKHYPPPSPVWGWNLRIEDVSWSFAVLQMLLTNWRLHH